MVHVIGNFYLSQLDVIIIVITLLFMCLAHDFKNGFKDWN